MGLMDDVAAADAELAYGDTDAFAVAATYTPYGGAPATINVYLSYGRLAAQSTDQRNTLQYDNTILAAVADMPSLKVNGDTISLPERVGGSTKTYRISSILAQDGGMRLLAITATN